jgi:hypothetical protein
LALYLAQLDVVIAQQEFPARIAHGRGAVAAAAGLVKQNRTMISDDGAQKLYRFRCRGDGRVGHALLRPSRKKEGRSSKEPPLHPSVCQEKVEADFRKDKRKQKDVVSV